MPLNSKRSSTSRKNREEKRRERTERVAHQIYQNRLLLKKPGNAQSDWETAEKIVQNPLKAAQFTSHRPFIQLERRTWQPLWIWANNQTFLSLIGFIANAGIILAVLMYIGSEQQRRDAEVLEAWQTLTSTSGQATASGAQLRALEVLNASSGGKWRRKFPWFCAPHPICTWPAENLGGINLSQDDSSYPGLELAGIQLPKAKLDFSNLERVNLVNANLAGANLEFSNLKNAILLRANLDKADLAAGHLENALLSDTSLKRADLWNANLENADLSYANLRGANLWDTNLENANLSYAILKRANLAHTNLKGASLLFVDLRKTQGLTQDRLKKAKLCFTTLSDGITLPPNRDCQELGIDPATGRRVASETSTTLEHSAGPATQTE